jgi:hypothetical protein
MNTKVTLVIYKYSQSMFRINHPLKAKLISETEELLMTVASQVKQVLATLKGSQGTIRLYAAQSKEEEIRAVYDEAVETTTEIINDLEKRLSLLEYQEPQYKGN